jgi:hypothetical protein
VRKFFVGAFVIVMGSLALAGSFQSRFVGANPAGPIHVAENEFMLVRNFTQEGSGASRGYVTWNDPTNNAPAIKVLDAAIVNGSPSPAPEEVVNSIIIAGPANVRFVCGDSAQCLATFKIDSN